MIDHAWSEDQQTYISVDAFSMRPSPCQPILLSTADISDSRNQVLSLIRCRMILTLTDTVSGGFSLAEAQISLK